MIHLAINFRHDLAALADQVGFDFQAVRQIGTMARFGNLPKLIDRLRHVLFRIVAARLIERKAANQLRFKRMGQFAGLLHVAGQIFFERHKGVLRAVVFVDQLHLAQRRADRRDVQAVLVFQMANFGDFRPRELHHVLDAAADIDEADAVILQARRRPRRQTAARRFFDWPLRRQRR